MDRVKRLTALHSETAELSDGADEVGLSLEELSQSYQRVLATAEPAGTESKLDSGSKQNEHHSFSSEFSSDELVLYDPLAESQVEVDPCPLTPRSIVEAILFVGRPDGGAIAASEIAVLMRGVNDAEVVELIEQLNAIYCETGRATRIVSSAAGFRLQLDDALHSVRDSFYGRARPVKLSQAAVDCLALISYQPGVTRETLEQQRGQPSGSVLNQLVRRQLIEMRRQSAGKQTVQHYYPTERLMDLAGIESLEDLPQTEDF
jgi:segregation and condensation protein B